MKYLVVALRTPEFQPAVIADHLEYLSQLREKDELESAGPFTDKSGGAYVLRASDLDCAKAIAFADPLHTSGASTVSVYEWDVC